jgi:hypothetical protein
MWNTRKEEKSIKKLIKEWVKWNKKEISGEDFALLFSKKFNHECLEAWNRRPEKEPEDTLKIGRVVEAIPIFHLKQMELRVKMNEWKSDEEVMRQAARFRDADVILVAREEKKK